MTPGKLFFSESTFLSRDLPVFTVVLLLLIKVCTSKNVRTESYAQ
jgi:hypothetical protein